MRTAVATLALANLAMQADRPPRPARPGSRTIPAVEPEEQVVAGRSVDERVAERAPVVGGRLPSGMDPDRATTARRSRCAVLAEARRFARFLVVGLGGTAIDFVLLVLLQGIGVPLLVANSVSFSAGACSNFVWNRRWTFADARARPWGVQLAQFFSVSLVGLAINDAIVVALQTPLGSLLGRPGQGYLAAKVAATGVAVLWNFFANRYWTFGDAGRAPATDPAGRALRTPRRTRRPLGGR